jgi:RimJ/RimL family protein N-acetyltransferase
VKLSARNATHSDSELLLAWRNNSGTRAQSRETRGVTQEEHLRWLESVLGSRDRQLFLVEKGDGTPIGSVRFDGQGGNVFEVSITIGPLHRGRGSGASVLLCAESFLTRSFSTAYIRAFIKPSNVASVRLFESAHYIPEYDRWWSKRLGTND